MDGLLDFVGEVYEASYNPGHWNRVMTLLCEKIMNARSGAIFIEDHQGGTRSMIGYHGLPKAVVASYRFGMGKYDYTFQAQRDEPVGQARQIIDSREVKDAHPYYFRLILKPNDIGFISGMNIYHDKEWQVGIGLHRSFNADPFSDEDIAKLRLLYPHFKRAIRIHREFHRLRTRQQTLHSALSRFMLGLIILEPDGTVAYRNPVADALLTHHNALALAGTGVKAYYADENTRLACLIQKQAKADPREINTRNTAIGLHHPDRDNALTVMLATLNADNTPDGGEPTNGSVALYISDPDSPLNIPAETLHTLYEMTQAESNVAIALTNGLSPGQIAENNGTSVDTVRSQLKAIYSKMGVSKQQDVIRTLLSGAMQVL